VVNREKGETKNNEKNAFNNNTNVATPLWGKCEDETHTPKSENLESSKTPKNLKLDCRGQNHSDDILHFAV
jgi:hypothetical protein